MEFKESIRPESIKEEESIKGWTSGKEKSNLELQIKLDPLQI
eukprot:CAMPEP_0202967706 /NCGR_PEP_ID=MMETSP1396-20130829/12715_1 /ASSEMBLY_ACC=CAM_ASM_000872 /TAXON_ID= /ORGANISM="Pseudokeronopsis sp., Strain Brazil" /LENGTH=41 /DNA_ID= /DNA_START= /DNA_END= /DNA_ORIENTATION=